MNVSLERLNDDYLFEVTNPNGHRVLLDNKSKTEGSVKGISPMELLLMGLAGCSSIDVVAILNKQKINTTPLKKVLAIFLLKTFFQLISPKRFIVLFHDQRR